MECNYNLMNENFCRNKAVPYKVYMVDFFILKHILFMFEVCRFFKMTFFHIILNHLSLITYASCFNYFTDGIPDTDPSSSEVDWKEVCT